MEKIKDKNLSANLALEIEHYEYHFKSIFRLFYASSILENNPQIDLECLAQLKKNLKYQENKIEMISILGHLVKGKRTFDDYKYLLSSGGWKLNMSMEKHKNET